MKNNNPDPTVFIELFKICSFRKIITSLLKRQKPSVSADYDSPLEFIVQKIELGAPDPKTIRQYGKIQAWKMYLFPEWFVENEGIMEEISDDLKIRFARLNNDVPTERMIRRFGLEEAMQRVLFPEKYYS